MMAICGGNDLRLGRMRTVNATETTRNSTEIQVDRHKQKPYHTRRMSLGRRTADRKSIAVRAVANLFTNHRLCPSTSRSAGDGFGPSAQRGAPGASEPTTS